MKKRYSLIVVSLTLMYFYSDLKAETGLNSSYQFRRRNYIVNMGYDSWRANIAIGSEMYFGEDDLLMISSKRVAPSFSLSAQKDIWGLVGLRVKYTFSGHKHFYYPSTIVPFTSMGLSADFMLNAAKVIAPFADKDIPKVWLFIGGGGEYSFEQALHKRYEINHKISLTYNMGSFVEIPLNENIDLSFEIRGNIVPEDFDGETGGTKLEGYATMLVGVTYHFN